MQEPLTLNTWLGFKLHVKRFNLYWALYTHPCKHAQIDVDEVGKAVGEAYAYGLPDKLLH